MADPTTSVLSNLTGTDEEPLDEGGNFAGPIETGTRQLRRLSNEAARGTIPAPSGTGTSYYLPSTFGPDSECFATLSTIPEGGGEAGVWARVTPGDSASYQAYLWVWVNGSNFLLVKRFANAFTVLDTDATVMSSGEKLWIDCNGSTIKGYHFTGGSWVERCSAVDTDITGAGRIGWSIQSSNDTRFDDIGGGTIVVGAEIQSFYTSRRRAWR